MAKPKTRTSNKARAKKRAPRVIAKDFSAAIKALRKVVVPKNLLPIKERAINSIFNLNDRINAEAGKVAKAEKREAAKADRIKAKAVREVAKTERKKARVAKLNKRIKALQAEAKKLG